MRSEKEKCDSIGEYNCHGYRIENYTTICKSGVDHCREQTSGGVDSRLIRKIDVRSTSVDSVEMYECYRPGDIVRAKVISLGDANRTI